MATPPGILQVVRWQFAFQRWATARVLETAAVIPHESLAAPDTVVGGIGSGSIFTMLCHVAGTEEHWTNRYLGDRDSTLLPDDAYGTVPGLIERWQANNRRLEDWLAGQSDASLAGILEFNRLNGTPDAQVLWQTLMHLANHTTHHRAEVCASLTALGSPPPSVDLIEFIRSGSPGA